MATSILSVCALFGVSALPPLSLVSVNPSQSEVRRIGSGYGFCRLEDDPKYLSALWSDSTTDRDTQRRPALSCLASLLPFELSLFFRKTESSPMSFHGLQSSASSFPSPQGNPFLPWLLLHIHSMDSPSLHHHHSPACPPSHPPSSSSVSGKHNTRTVTNPHRSHNLPTSASVEMLTPFLASSSSQQQ
ncbi:hypothetical protein ATANTOWER_024896 [Ataeniobius toweri]|uniref:Uncharacterized protein n=1 Tax=Ataeniobius toweri TaxID=208326 RepID=A0ABU7AK51_9TELE|nr:hypothetical protein [Ataeniobius toweri]